MSPVCKLQAAFLLRLLRPQIGKAESADPLACIFNTPQDATVYKNREEKQSDQQNPECIIFSDFDKSKQVVKLLNSSGCLPKQLQVQRQNMRNGAHVFANICGLDHLNLRV